MPTKAGVIPTTGHRRIAGSHNDVMAGSALTSVNQ